MQNENEIGESIWGLSESEVEELRQKAINKALNTKHDWKQKGFWLVCKSCEYPHASWIGKDKRLVGLTDEGEPIFEGREKG